MAIASLFDDVKGLMMLMILLQSLGSCKAVKKQQHPTLSHVGWSVDLMRDKIMSSGPNPL